MRTRANELRKHLEYMVPQLRLVILKEPGVKAKCITMHGDVERFVEPLKYSDVFVPTLFMCPPCKRLSNSRNQAHRRGT